MAEITKPMFLDETGKKMLNALEQIVTGYEVITDETSESVTLDIEGGKMYKYGTLASLDIQSIETSNLESVVEFTTAEEFTVTLPDTYQSIGEISLEGGKSYILSVMNGVIVSGEVSTTTKSEEETA